MIDAGGMAQDATLAASDVGTVETTTPAMTACIRGVANDIGSVGGVLKPTTVWLEVTVRKNRAAGSRP